MVKNLKKLKNWQFFVLKKAAKNFFEFFLKIFFVIYLFIKNHKICFERLMFFVKKSIIKL